MPVGALVVACSSGGGKPPPSGGQIVDGGKDSSVHGDSGSGQDSSSGGSDAQGTDAPTDSLPPEGSTSDSPSDSGDGGCGHPTTMLASGTAGDFALAGASVAFVLGGDLESVPIAGGTPTTLSSGTNPQRLVVDGSTIFFTAGNAVMRVSTGSDAGASTVATGTAAAGAIAVDANNVYWVESTAPPQIAFAPKTGGTAATFVADAGAGAGSPNGGTLVLAAGTLYWLDAEAAPSGQLLSASTGGTPPVSPTVLVSGGNGGFDLQLVGNNVFWTDANGGYSASIFAAPPGDGGLALEGGVEGGLGGVTPTSIPGLQNQFFFDSQDVYVLTQAGVVQRAPRNVWAYQPLYCGSGPATKGRIVADATYVYFTTDAGLFRTDQ